jgi:hypothetical protein
MSLNEFKMKIYLLIIERQCKVFAKQVNKSTSMIKMLSARYTSSHNTDIYIRYADTDIPLKFTDRVTRFLQHKTHFYQ